jgi:O-antigen ligase
VLLLSFAEGGFRPAAWRAATVALLAAGALGLVLRGPVRPSRAQLLVGVGFAALAAWAALSAVWSPDPHASLLEAQRTLVYLALAFAATVLGGSLLADTLTGIGLVCLWSVGQRLLEGPPSPPDPFEGTLLQEPLGYANGLGGLAAIALAVLLTALVRDRTSWGLKALLLGLFAATLLLTASRGGAVAAGAGAAVGLALACRRVGVARVAAATAGLALFVVLVLSAGSLAEDLAGRGGDRPWYWHVAWTDVRQSPLAGRGAGTFHLTWLEERPIGANVRDAHSLYLETLSELGALGLALLLLALAPPLVLALRGTGPSGAAAGYTAFLVHAGADWDWELPAVTVAGLLCGFAVLCANAQVRCPGFVYSHDIAEPGGARR